MRNWRLQRGAHVLGDGRVRFSVWAPLARRMEIVLRAENTERRTEMPGRGEAGVFELELSDVSPGADYLLSPDGKGPFPDPVSRWLPEGVHGPTRIVDPAGFAWSDATWHGRPLADTVFYELHVGTFTPAGTFDAVIDKFDYLIDLGVNTIQLMPVAQFPGTRNWGYDGASLYAVQDSYGGPEGLRRLVDAAHARGLAVFADVVYNHLGPEGNYLSQYGPYFTDRYRTPWGSALNYDGPFSDEVRRFFLDHALHLITEYHMDGLRLDAVHAIFDFSARHILDELAEEVHLLGRSLGREVSVVAESDLNDPRLLRAREIGGYGLDGQWSDDFHHAVHARLTGERKGYYGDFGGTEHLARALSQRYVVGGRYSDYRGRRHGAPADDVPADRFVVFIQNHDQVGNRAEGDRFGTLLSFEQQKLAACLMLLSPYVPLIFMGDEYGESNPFLYFVSHGDPDLVAAVREGRRSEFKAFGWGEEIPDPQAESTFEQSRPDPGKAQAGRHAMVFRLYRELLMLRRSEPALRPGRSRIEVVADPKGRWLAWTLTPPIGRVLMAVVNFERGGPLEISRPGRWSALTCTELQTYGGSLAEESLGQVASTNRDGLLRIELPPQSAALLAREIQ